MNENFHDKDHQFPHEAADMNDRLLHLFLDINHMMRSQYEGRGSQKRILIILLESGRITQRSLTERIGIQPGSASEVIAKLEKNGLIIRSVSPDDRRTADITLTDQGRILAEEAAAQRRTRHEEMFSCLSEEEKNTLLGLLGQLCSDWQERYGGAGHSPRGRHRRKDGAKWVGHRYGKKEG